jgi:DNA adenine methylase
VRTPLTYYGGKQKLANQIAAMMPPHVTYLEPFCGGAAVLFAKPPAECETINDLDGSVMRFWRALRERPEELAAAVAMTPDGRAEWQASLDGDVDDDVEAARRLLVNCDQSFSRSRKSWSPPSMHKDRRGRWQPGTWANLPAKILAAAERLSGVCLDTLNLHDLHASLRGFEQLGYTRSAMSQSRRLFVWWRTAKGDAAVNGEATVEQVPDSVRRRYREGA